MGRGGRESAETDSELAQVVHTCFKGITGKGQHGESEKAASGPSIIVNGGLAIDQIIKGLLGPRWRWKEEKAAGKGGAEETTGGTSQTELARRKSPLKKTCFWTTKKL